MERECERIVGDFPMHKGLFDSSKDEPLAGCSPIPRGWQKWSLRWCIPAQNFEGFLPIDSSNPRDLHSEHGP